MGEQHQCIQEARIRALETEQVETRVYLKVIREDVSEIKQTLKQRPPALQGWPQVVSELIKLIMLALLILGGIAGVTKLISMGGGGIP